MSLCTRLNNGLLRSHRRLNPVMLLFVKVVKVVTLVNGDIYIPVLSSQDRNVFITNAPRSTYNNNITESTLKLTGKTFQSQFQHIFD